MRKRKLENEFPKLHRKKGGALLRASFTNSNAQGSQAGKTNE